MDDVQRFKLEYGDRSTPDMLRVARIGTDPDDAYKWVATAPGRQWEYANGDWTCGPEYPGTTGHRYDEDFFRYMLGEQLWHLGIRSDSLIWDRH